MRLQSYLIEQQRPITIEELNRLEYILDSFFETVGIDIEFTKHFLDRVNDKRNKKQITIEELQLLFTKTYKKFGKVLSKLHPGTQGVLDDIQDDINVPFVLVWDKKTKMLDLISKTVMRKKNFKTTNRIFKI